MKNKLPKSFSLIEMLLCIVIIGLLAFFALPACAQESFNMTNRMDNAISLINWPTNTTGINTGKGIGVQNYDVVGITVQGQVDGASNLTWSVGFVRSDKASPPSTSADWEHTETFTVSGAANAGGRIYTNLLLPATFVRSANWIGLCRATNTANGTASITNWDVRVDKKIIPIRYP